MMSGLPTKLVGEASAEGDGELERCEGLRFWCEILGRRSRKCFEKKRVRGRSSGSWLFSTRSSLWIDDRIGLKEEMKGEDLQDFLLSKPG